MKGVSKTTTAIIVVVAVIVSCLATIAAYRAIAHPTTVTVTKVKTVSSIATTTITKTVALPTTSVSVVTTTVTKPVTTTVPKTIVTTVSKAYTRTVPTTVTTTLTKTLTTVSISTKTLVVGGVTVKEIPVLYAKLFRLWNASGYIVAEDAEHQLFILVPPEMKVPSKAFIDSLVKGLGLEPRKIFVVRVPIHRAVFLSTTEVALLYRVAKELGNLSMLNTIVGVSYGQWWIPYVAKLVESGKAKVVASYSGINYEEILALKPTIVFMYTGFPAMEKALEKLESLGLKVAVDNEWLETSYLGRFEWIKFIAAFYGPKALEKAIEIFNHVAKVRAQLELALKQYAEISGKHPTFLWFFPSLKWGIWAPKKDAYPIKYLESLGAKYVLASYVPSGSGSVPVNKEVIAKVACSADVWIISSGPPYVNSIDDVAKVLGSWIYECPAVKNHRVFFYGPSYWQLGYAYTELVLKDLASILYPNAPMLKGYQRTFFHHLWRKGVEVKLGGFTIEYEGFYKVVEDASGRKWVIVPFDVASYVPKSVTSSVNGLITIPIKSVVTDLEGYALLEPLGLSSLVKAVMACNKSLMPPPLAKDVEGGLVKYLGCPAKGINASALKYLGKALIIVSIANAKYLTNLPNATIITLPRIVNVTLGLSAVKAVSSLFDEEYAAQSYASSQLSTLRIVKALAAKVSKHPSAVCAYLEGSRVLVATNSSILAQLLSELGISYVAKGSRPWVSMSLSDFVKEFSNVTLLVVLNNFANVTQLTNEYPQLASLTAVKERNVVFGSGPYVALYALSEPGTVAKELAKCVYPGIPLSYTPRLFHRTP